MVPVIALLPWMVWSASWITHIHTFFIQHLFQFAIVFICMFFAALYPAFFHHRRYRMLGEYRREGVIPADVVYSLLRSLEASDRSMKWCGTIIGLVPVGVAIASYSTLGRGSVGIFLFALTALALAPYLTAIVIASQWLRLRFLGLGDLVIQ